MDTETIVAGDTGLYSKTITRKYEGTGTGEIPGRPAGFIVGQETEYEVTYGYDQYGRLNRISDGPGLPAYGAVYNRLANSELVAYLRYSSEEQTTLASAQRAYEANRDLVDYVENRTSPAPADPVSRYDYANDPERGRRTSVIETGTAFTAASYNLYGYNTRSELTDAERYLGDEIEDPPQNPVAGEDFRYMYDTIGNRRYYIDAAGTHTCNRNNLNQYYWIGNPATDFTYDDDGNLDTDGKYKYLWDAENRLISVAPVSQPVNGDKKLTFAYDYMSRRVRKTAWTHDGSDWQEDSDLLFVYDAWNVVMVLDANDDNAILRKYTWGLDLSGWSGNATVRGLHAAGGIGGLLAVEEPQAVGDPERYWYLYDANGNVGQVIDAGDSSIAAKYRYDPYGNTVYAEGPYALANPFRFSTKWWDGLNAQAQAEALYYYGYRFYSPHVGRWINRDPIEESGGPNLYQFIGNTPLNQVDPDGRLWPGIPTRNDVRFCYSPQDRGGPGAGLPDPVDPVVNNCAGAFIQYCLGHGSLGRPVRLGDPMCRRVRALEAYQALLKDIDAIDHEATCGSSRRFNLPHGESRLRPDGSGDINLMVALHSGCKRAGQKGMVMTP